MLYNISIVLPIDYVAQASRACDCVVTAAGCGNIRFSKQMAWLDKRSFALELRQLLTIGKSGAPKSSMFFTKNSSGRPKHRPCHQAYAKILSCLSGLGSREFPHDPNSFPCCSIRDAYNTSFPKARRCIFGSGQEAQKPGPSAIRSWADFRVKVIPPSRALILPA